MASYRGSKIDDTQSESLGDAKILVIQDFWWIKMCQSNSDGDKNQITAISKLKTHLSIVFASFTTVIPIVQGLKGSLSSLFFQAIFLGGT